MTVRLTRNGDGTHSYPELGITDIHKVTVGQKYAVTQWEATRNDTVAIFSTLSDLRRWLDGLERRTEG